MKLYEITLKPQGAFGTPLKGDTVFGHFCWQAAYDPELLEGGLDRQISTYAEKPFAVFSSAFPKLGSNPSVYAVKRPDVPTPCGCRGGSRKERVLLLKDHARKKWMLIEGVGRVALSEAKFLTGEELAKYSTSGSRNEGVSAVRKAEDSVSVSLQPHNTINRCTSTTGEGMFAPFLSPTFQYWSGLELAIFVLVDELATDIERVRIGLERIGAWGFGRDASTGIGRFLVSGHSPLNFPETQDAGACLALAPSVPDHGCFKKVFYSPFIRFGKHGDVLATSRNPFKNPVIMADEGAVYIAGDRGVFEKPYVGRAVSGVSRAKPETMVQGYAPYLPIKLEK